MSDISSAVSKLLQDNQAMNYIQDLIGSLSDNNNNNSGNDANQNFDNPNPPQNNNEDFDINALMNIGKMFANNNSGSGDVERLLDALIPFLSDKRRKKASSAKKMLKIVSLLPLLKSTGLLEGFLGTNSD